MWLILIPSILLWLVYTFGIKPYRYWREKGVPYVKPVPFFGNVGLNLLGKKALPHILEDIYKAYPDKRYVGFYQFLSPTLVVRDPNLIKKIAVKDFHAFPEHKLLVSADLDPIWSKNLVAMRGDQKWHDLRSTLSPFFTSNKMRMMFGLIKECTQQFSGYFQKQNGDIKIEMKDVFSRFTNDIIATVAFGVECDSLKNRNNEFYLMGRDATDFGLKFLLHASCPTLMKFLNVGILSKPVTTFFRNTITEILQVRQEKGIIRPDMIHLLTEARKGGHDNDSKEVVDSGFAVVRDSEPAEVVRKRKTIAITDEDIVAQAVSFFIAGFDTTSTFLCFTSYELAVNTDIQEKLRKEIDETMEDCNGDITYEALLGMKYLDMVVSESLRKWPPAITAGRSSIRQFILEPELPGEHPVTLDKGTNVWIPIYALHRDPKYYPDPELFDPERFNDKNKGNIKPYTYLPFGTGPRSCMGSRFALLEGKLLLVELLSKFELQSSEKTQVPLQLNKTSFMLVPEKGCWLNLKPRNPQQ